MNQENYKRLIKYVKQFLKTDNDRDATKWITELHGTDPRKITAYDPYIELLHRILDVKDSYQELRDEGYLHSVALVRSLTPGFEPKGEAFTASLNLPQSPQILQRMVRVYLYSPNGYSDYLGECLVRLHSDSNRSYAYDEDTLRVIQLYGNSGHIDRALSEVLTKDTVSLKFSLLGTLRFSLISA